MELHHLCVRRHPTAHSEKLNARNSDIYYHGVLPQFVTFFSKCRKEMVCDVFLKKKYVKRKPVVNHLQQYAYEMQERGDCL